MEFLHPVQHDRDHVILLLVVSKNGKSKLIWYEWDTQTCLHDAQLNPSTHTLPAEDCLPLLLIPLLAFNAFILVSETGISIYKDLLTGTPSRFIHELAHNEEAEELASSKKSPIWVQWARPMRSPSRRPSDDYIYLCREDGIVRYIDIKYNLPQMLDSNHDAGKLGTYINSSFAVIDLGPAAYDLLVAGGDSSEGGHWLFSARKAAEHLSSRPNWTPLLDSVRISAPSECGGIFPNHVSMPGDARKFQRLLVCAGKAKHGSIAELRHGIRVERIADPVVLGSDLTYSILSIWALPSAQDAKQVLISHSTSSSLLIMWDDNHWELLDKVMGMDLDSTTIAVTSITDSRVLQITETKACINFAPNLVSQKPIWEHNFSEFGERVVAADTAGGDSCCQVVLAVQREHDFFLRYGVMGTKFAFIGEAVPLQARPTCVSLHSSKSRTLVFVGNVDGSIEIFADAYEESFKGLRPVGHWRFNGSYQICDSIAILVLNHDEESLTACLVVCGLRNGQLHTLWFPNGISCMS